MRCGRRSTSGASRATARSSNRGPTPRPGRRARSSTSRVDRWISRSPMPAVSPTGSRAGCCAPRTARTSGWCSIVRRVRSATSWSSPAVLDATIVQRHPDGIVRVVGAFGVLRWRGFNWQHEPPVGTWIDAVTASTEHGDADVLDALLEFAVHDLGSRGIGSLLIYRPRDDPGPPVEERLPAPPPLRDPRRAAPRSAPARAGAGRRGGRLRRRRRAPSDRRPVGTEPRGRAARGAARWNAPYIRASLQLRRSPRHGHRGERRRPGLGAPQR